MARVRVNAAQSGQVVEVNPGDTVVVELAESIATGYSWELDEPLASGPVTMVESTHEPPDQALMGAPGRCTVLLEAQSAGVAEIVMRLRRPWEPPTEAVERFEIRVVVSGAGS